MIKHEYKITDPSGLHARPATMIASCCMEHESAVTVTSDGHMVNGSDVLALMGLYVKIGQTILFQIEGSDEEATFADLKQILNTL